LSTPSIAFIGITESGKTHSITLLGITAVELELKGLAHILIDEDTLPLHEFMESVRDGRVLDPTKINPDEKTFGCKIHLSYPKWGGLTKKKVTITPLDASGELLKAVMQNLPNVRTVDELIKRMQEKGYPITRQDVDNIRNFILSADGYILTIDLPVLLGGKSGDRRIEQNIGLVRFMRQLRDFRRRAFRAPHLRGMAVLLTKTDLAIPDVKSEQDVDGILRKYLSSLIPELNEVKEKGGKIGLFHSWLKVIEENGFRRIETIDHMPVYSYDQYEKLLFWIRDTF